MKKENFIIIFALFFILSLYFTDQILKINYLLKVSIKVILIYLSYILGKIYFNMDFKFLKLKKLKKYKLGFILSIFTFIIIYIGFYIIKDFIDFSTIKKDFLYKYQLDGIKFFIAAIYLVFINSLLEEYFFRGFIFLNFKNKLHGNIVSSTFFSIYHISNFQNWLDNPMLLFFPLVGLIMAGLLFNYLVSKSNDIYNSYIPHMFADLSISIIGYFIIIH